MSRLFCFGLGYSAARIARTLASEGWQVGGTARTQKGADAISASGYQSFVFDGQAPNPAITDALAGSTHVLVSAPPGDDDPVLRHHGDDLRRAASLQWIGYLSTIGVYGDRNGGWVDETSATDATSVRGRQRVAAEASWLALGQTLNVPTQIFRLAGIYGVGRSAIDKLREGTAHRIIKPDQVFNRIHVDDIARTVCAAMVGPTMSQVYNVTDDEPAPPQDVVTYAAELLGVAPPPEVPYADAQLSPMARSFYADNKRASNARLHQELGVTLKFPTYREGLRAILAELSGR
ncbi:SDR family oxidoreductase [Hyphomicrobium sp. 1Nfss2.1]|uniref:SDR family oxidoreductase n=1 Tax=Hyphomicrobium sp. 1Nfss2.1 TaxID=3413936 RepID=UPI003C7CAEE5